VVLGRGQNPVNFVSVGDVAALVDLVVSDPGTRGQTLEIGGPDELTMDELAQLVAPEGCGSRGPRHVPPAALRLLAATVGRLRPAVGRQVRAALAMDTASLTFDRSRDVRRRWPELPCTEATAVLDEPGSDVHPPSSEISS
jgi:NADH dehydrogenase